MISNNINDSSTVDMRRTEDENSPNTSTLPIVRPTNILRLLFVVEFISILIIWFARSQNENLVDDIIHFNFSKSMFDLLSISTLKVILLFILLTEFELHRNRSSIKYIILANTTSFIYGTIKFIFILHYQGNLSAVCIFLVMSFLELIGGILKNQSIHTPRIVSLIKPERSWILTASLFLLIASFIEIIDIYLCGRVVSLAIEKDSMHSAGVMIGILLSLDTVAAIATFFYSSIFALAGQRMVQRLRLNIFNAILKQDISFFDENRTGELTSRLSSDTQVVQDCLTENLSALIQNCIHIVGSLIVMFYLNYKLTLVLLILVPIIGLITIKYGKVIENLRKIFQDKLAESANIADESISNIRTCRIFGAERKLQKNYHDSLLQSFLIGKRLAFNNGLFSGVIELLVAGGICGVLWFGAKLLHDRTLSIGVLTSFLLYMLQVALASAFLAEIFTGFMQAVGASKRTFALMDQKPTIPSIADVTCSIKPQEFVGHVRFDHVHFTYPSRPEAEALSDISFSIEPGQKVALVGPSGGGKSTITSLIERFYDPKSGGIYFGTDRLSSIDPQWIRQNVSFVNQEPSLFSCSIRDNITLGFDRNEISLDRIIEVARQANAHEFIEQLENKYDTMVGERGICLSGGQKQRLAIARALLMNPRLLILDEATSALDAHSEYLIDQTIEQLTMHRTLLVIAHRLSTVRNADLIIVIDQGKIVEQGTHDSLMSKQNGIYKNLVFRQLMPIGSD